MGQRERGIYGKFIVKRTDGSHRHGRKHDGCDYFVLDCRHDPHAVAALRAYADSCQTDGYELLAADVRRKANELADAMKPPGGEGSSHE